MPEQDMKYAFVDNRAMYLGDMIDLIIKKDPCTNKVYAIKKLDHTSHLKFIPKNTHKIEANHVTKK